METLRTGRRRACLLALLVTLVIYLFTGYVDFIFLHFYRAFSITSCVQLFAGYGTLKIRVWLSAEWFPLQSTGCEFESQPANPGLILDVSYFSHWWRFEGYLVQWFGKNLSVHVTMSKLSNTILQWTFVVKNVIGCKICIAFCCKIADRWLSNNYYLSLSEDDDSSHCNCLTGLGVVVTVYCSWRWEVHEGVCSVLWRSETGSQAAPW